MLYGELRGLAARQFRGQRANHTLQATGLVHEAFLRLVGYTAEEGWKDSKHFFAVAATAMRLRSVAAVARRRLGSKRCHGEARDPGRK